jgi:hypothetical protein
MSRVTSHPKVLRINWDWLDDLDSNWELSRLISETLEDFGYQHVGSGTWLGEEGPGREMEFEWGGYR